MTEADLQLTRGVGFAAAGLVAVLLQRLAPHAHRGGTWRVNGGLWLVNALVVGAACGACGFAAARWAAEAGLGVLHQAEMGAWVTIPLTVATLDLVSYAWHRANHRVALLWRSHQVHHSDPTFTVSTGVRFHPGELLLSLPVRLAAVVLLGASAEAVLAFEVAFTCTNLVEHGDIDLPRRLERALGLVVITPALHRRHHTQRRPARDTNFGTIFSVWDRLLGTYARADSATRVATGLPGLERVSLRRALLLPLGRPVA